MPESENEDKYKDFLKKCIECDKKCANCIDNKEKISEVRNAFYNYERNQNIKNTTFEDKLEIVKTMPSLKRDLYITMGTAVFGAVLLGFILNGNATTTNKIETIKEDIKASNLHLTDVRSNISEERKRDREVTIMQTDIKYLKNKTDKMDGKIDIILERLPKR